MKHILLLTILFFWLSELTGQTNSVFALMQKDSITDIYLRLNWKELIRKKMDKSYVPGQISFEKSPGDTSYFNVNVRTRGNMRLNICTYPPVKIRFNKGELATASLKPLNEIDLVHNCHNGD